MKKLLFVAAFISAGIMVNAQVNFGAKAGANFYQFGGEDGRDLTSQKMKVGFNAGLLANIPVSDIISFQPELLFSNQGTMQKEGDEKATWNLNYINVPLMVQYNNASGFYAETGPELGFLMSAKLKAEVGNDSETIDIKDSFKGFNFSWGIGLGYKLQSGIGFGARYVHGLSSIIDEDDAKATNYGFHIGVFYMFGGRK